jgi:hypothetical protein
MKILYLTTPAEDYLGDNILYGLRQKYGSDVIDYPKKEVMYSSCQKPNHEIYGNGFTLYKRLPEVTIDRSDDVMGLMFGNQFDLVVFSDIWRMQQVFAHFTVYRYFEKTKAKFAFLDGTDDGFPTIYDAFHRGTYFKRDNPFRYPEIKIIGLSIPAAKLLKAKPEKKKQFTRYVQCDEAYKLDVIQQHSSTKRFESEDEYYQDLADSRYGITMKKSGWDVPRHMENASQWAVNCIYAKGWEWDGVDWEARDSSTHPLGLIDMQNCIVWHDAKELDEKIGIIESTGVYSQLSESSRAWVETKTCEAMTDYFLKNI